MNKLPAIEHHVCSGGEAIEPAAGRLAEPGDRFALGQRRLRWCLCHSGIAFVCCGGVLGGCTVAAWQHLGDHTKVY